MWCRRVRAEPAAALAPRDVLRESWFCEGERYAREVLERVGSSSSSWEILGCLVLEEEGDWCIEGGGALFLDEAEADVCAGGGGTG
jgi:hypothetical protein